MSGFQLPPMSEDDKNELIRRAADDLLKKPLDQLKRYTIGVDLAAPGGDHTVYQRVNLSGIDDSFRGRPLTQEERDLLRESAVRSFNFDQPETIRRSHVEGEWIDVEAEVVEDDPLQLGDGEDSLG